PSGGAGEAVLDPARGGGQNRRGGGGVDAALQGSRLRRGHRKGTGAPCVRPGEPEGREPLLRGNQRQAGPPGAGAGRLCLRHRAPHRGGAGEQQHEAGQRDPGGEVPHPLGAGLSDGHPLRPGVQAVGAVLLPGEPGSGGSVVRQGPGLCRPDGAGDGAGPVLRHRHHYTVPGEAGRTGHRR
ncbi:Phage transcriptional regulator, RinA family, partial [Dysosmobacter welbionis]